MVDHILAGKDEVAGYLRMSVKQFDRYLIVYPFDEGKTNGRWRVPASEVLAWWNDVREKERRRVPDVRVKLLRPMEAPDLQEIKGR